MAEPARSPSLSSTVVALGIAQIISWGSLFYTIAVLGPALRTPPASARSRSTRCYSIGLVVSGLVAPAIGRRIDARGGRLVLSAGSLLGAIACAALALVQGPVDAVADRVVAGRRGDGGARSTIRAFATLRDAVSARSQLRYSAQRHRH